MRATAASGLAAAGSLSSPRIGRAADGKVLRFVPSADLANFDPVWTTQIVVRNAAILIWDMLYGIDSKLEPQPQMVDAHEITPDFKTWTFRLRPDLRFHDNEPVLSRDVVASIVRWMGRDTMGIRIKAQLDALDSVDDRTFRFRLNAPFPRLLYALGKCYSPLVIMPERIAATSPFKQVTEFVGSGPARFRADSWVPGSQAVFERFAGYVPRSETASWLAGGKRIVFDRIEWKTIPDSATVAAALQNGEVDWCEVVTDDLVPLLRKSPGVSVGTGNPMGNICDVRVNHLHPPFNDLRARRALQMSVDQTDYMTAAFGDDPSIWQRSASFFIPGTPLYSEQGGEPLKGKRNLALAKTLLAEAGYRDEPIVLLVPTDIAVAKAWGDVTADLLKQLGMNVRYEALDWGTVGKRRAKTEKPADGGWHMFVSAHPGDSCVNPAAYSQLEASGDAAWFGWPKSDAVQAKFAEWYAAPDIAAEKIAVAGLNQAAMEHVVYIPGGFYKGLGAWRTNVTGIVSAPFPMFWDVSKN